MESTLNELGTLGIIEKDDVLIYNGAKNWFSKGCHYTVFTETLSENEEPECYIYDDEGDQWYIYELKSETWDKYKPEPEIKVQNLPTDFKKGDLFKIVTFNTIFNCSEGTEYKVLSTSGQTIVFKNDVDDVQYISVNKVLMTSRNEPNFKASQLMEGDKLVRLSDHAPWFTQGEIYEVELKGNRHYIVDNDDEQWYLNQLQEPLFELIHATPFEKLEQTTTEPTEFMKWFSEFIEQVASGENNNDGKELVGILSQEEHNKPKLNNIYRYFDKCGKESTLATDRNYIETIKFLDSIGELSENPQLRFIAQLTDEEVDDKFVTLVEL